MTWGQAVAGFVKELARQQGSRGLSFRATGLLRPVYQHLLNLIPDRRVNDRGMLALKDLPFVPDAPGVDRVAQDVMDVSAIKGVPPETRPAPRTRRRDLRPRSFRTLFHDTNEAMFQIELIECL